MNCMPRQGRRHSGAGGCTCGCGGGMFFRRFISAEEEKERLEEYEAQLKKELKGVEESIKELKKS